jgi:hypothetical protein
MAQKDAKANIDIAKDTSFLARASKEDSAVMRTIAIEAKNDGSSIKTIAVLGMLFLPSTLIAVGRLFLRIPCPLKLTSWVSLSSPRHCSAGVITAFPSPMQGSNTTWPLPCR